MKVLPLPAPSGAATDSTLGDETAAAAAGFVAALAEALAAASEVPAETAGGLGATDDAPDAVDDPDTPDDPAVGHRSATAVAALGAIAEWQAAGRTDKLGEIVRAA
ncbi:MAG TPA: hypothetical protein VK904_08560, partial [Miltoncostaeaceae bacterium]|nr:hypothetical protein [Miltoncostaeaceae bacterium]